MDVFCEFCICNYDKIVAVSPATMSRVHFANLGIQHVSNEISLANFRERWQRGDTVLQ